MRPVPARPVQVREARTSGAAASSDAEKIAGRIVEYGTAVDEANWSMLSWARWLIPSESAEALSTDSRVTCSTEPVAAAALIAIRCRTPSIPTDPIAMNTAAIPSKAPARSRGSSSRVARMCSPPGSPNSRRALPGSRTSAVTASPRASTPRTISLPTRPVAPITAVVIVSPCVSGRGEILAAATGLHREFPGRGERVRVAAACAGVRIVRAGRCRDCAASTVDEPWRKVPRKVQPYGSGDETEAAALARSRPDPAPGYVNELAATMTIGQVATQAVEAVRALNQLTADPGELAGPGEAREVVGRLALMGHQLPPLCEQLARFLVAQREDGQIARGTGGDPDGVLAEVSEALSAAGRAADMMAAALAEAGAKAGGLDMPSR